MTIAWKTYILTEGLGLQAYTVYHNGKLGSFIQSSVRSLARESTVTDLLLVLSAAALEAVSRVSPFLFRYPSMVHLHVHFSRSLFLFL